MKVVILAGGLGTRLSEETEFRPKPMVEIGGFPILWHIMKVYSFYGYNDFIICLGYRGYIIKEYFANYFMHMADVTFNLQTNEIEVHEKKAEPWRVTVIDTGRDTMTGGRIKQIKKYVGDETFMVTYGDGIGDVAIDKLVDFHSRHGRIGTMTVVQPSGRFGSLEIDDNDHVKNFREKPRDDGAWINGGFFVFTPDIFEYIEGDKTVFENEPLINLSYDDELIAYRHTGFWKAMDTLREKKELETMWTSGRAPWRIWSST